MMKQILLIIALVIGPIALAPGLHAQSADESAEYLIKAGFIYNFAKFVEWPAGAYTLPGSPIVIAVVGNDEFGATLERVTNNKKVESRGFVIRRLKDIKDLQVKDYSIVFIAESKKSQYDAVIQALKGSSVLTIAEAPGFAQRGGMINFTLENNNVRFEVNVEAAKQAGLNISSRLLSLSKIVQPGMAWR
jgi:hypothetical protein